MAQTGLPFAYDQQTAPRVTEEFLDSLPHDLRLPCEQSPFLAEYLRQVPIDEIGMPKYFSKPNRNMGQMDPPNLIYPIKDGLYVHIYPDATGARNHYIPIEPTTVVSVDHLVAQVDEKLIGWAEEIGRLEDKEEKRKLLLQLIDYFCTTQRRPANGSRRPDKICVTPEELEGVRYRILRDKVGLGVLQPLLLDPFIEDISCSGVGHIFVEHKMFKSVQSSIVFATHDEVDDFVVWLGEWIKHPVTVRNPLVDAVLPDGSRINIVYGREISKRGSNFTIRKFSGTPISVLELIGFGSLDYMIAAYLSLMLEEGLNLFVVGATASGKTTLLNAINTFLKPDAKIVTIEDTPEVHVPHKNWVQEVTRSMGAENKGGEVGMFELLKAALRQRPDRIIVGEIRAIEAVVAFQAMQTGHGVMSTFHADSVEKLIQRLTGEPINIPKTYIDNLHLAVIQQAVRLSNGKMARRVLSVNEIIGYDPVTETFSFLEAFRWNPTTDTFEFPGYMNSYLLEQVIAIRRGIPPHKRKSIYDEVKRRARIFEKLHKEKGVTDFDEFFQILCEARRQNLL
ncbi:MAG TPA: type II/IV secretion system ATPase subunit [Aggregatilinea sp.]|jgi:flagellar protein FlaI|uniref:type II/IV secretion system ATPase subunit n=1 Tax=Aggregatilinea sp. TaxID=2806333 RepID=UPI002C78BC2C|nr:type II/IV secretion system ATPase subunit [Aggregatilinea sp.]HML20612.1 type II/IV secretion system ATPase subunit [Aggregatilinea sp.]